MSSSSEIQSSFVIVAVDGGAAAGKSSTSRALAARFHLLHVDTGMHYRAVTYCLMQTKIEPEAVDRITAYLEHIPMATLIHGNSAFVTIDGVEPEAALLRSEAINQAVSAYAAIPQVRAYLLGYQRGHVDLARRHGFKGIIMEGRDIGSVVLPDADLRFFLEADPQARSLRRIQDNTGADDIKQRDARDSSRKIAPLMCPEGAKLINTTHLELQAVIELLAADIKVSLR